MAIAGDRLAVFLFFVGTAIACGLAALTTRGGWRVWLLWAATAVFAFASFDYIDNPPSNGDFVSWFAGVCGLVLWNWILFRPIWLAICAWRSRRSSASPAPPKSHST